ncbi:flagellar hook-basal body complex protein FliE [Sulfitobacter aestuarii]|uniref:Flagellar hook-basal body complex protein FliE n=1 Tax=Sulfitobacter aestuarii TaxID=2161676 RepID=A0ABW5U1R6_9RHOB
MSNAINGLNGAARAYQAAQSLPAAKPAAPEEPRAASFSEMLGNTAQETLQTIRAGDASAVAGLQGQLTTQQVVEATMAMESAVKVSTAVRDRVVEAYQEVLRMAV